MELYVESFPRDERMPVREVASQVASQFWHLFVASVDGALVGLSWFGYVPAARVGFLIYLAVDPGSRGSGIGRKLVLAAIDRCWSDAAACGREFLALCFEVERADLALSDEDEVVRLKRLAWFESLGAECLSPGYTQPAMAPDRNPVPLNLMALDIADGVDRRQLAFDFCVHCVGYSPDALEVATALVQLGSKWR
jgi:GNAT superfamily N-acetyltransferase